MDKKTIFLIAKLTIASFAIAASKTHCPKGEFFNLNRHFCTPCDPCKPGYGILKTCSNFTDAICQICAEGTFSKPTLFGRICQNCSTCAAGVKIIQSCNGTHDTFCEMNKQDENKAHPTVVPRSTIETYIYVIVILSTLLVLAVSGIGGAMWKIRKNRSQQRNRENDPSTASEARCLDVSASSFSSLDDPRMRRFKNDNDSIQSSLLSASGSDKVFKKTLKDPDFLISNLPGHVLENLGKLLNPNLLYKDWKSLAGRLGYTAMEVENLKNNHRMDYTESMLFSYSTRDTKANIGFLYDLLHDMERVDAANVLYGFDNLSYTRISKTRVDTPV